MVRFEQYFFDLFGINRYSPDFLGIKYMEQLVLEFIVVSLFIVILGLS